MTKGLNEQIKYGLYIRGSYIYKDGKERRENKVRTIFANSGCDIVQTYYDYLTYYPIYEGTRDGFEQLLDDLVAGKINGIITENPDFLCSYFKDGLTSIARLMEMAKIKRLYLGFADKTLKREKYYEEMSKALGEEFKYPDHLYQNLPIGTCELVSKGSGRFKIVNRKQFDVCQELLDDISITVNGVKVN